MVLVHFLQGVQLSPLGFAACQSKNCTNQVNYTYCLVGALLAMLVHFLLCWCTSCYVGALLAMLVHLRQVHPLIGHFLLCWCSCLRGCSCLNSTNQVNHTFCLVGALLAWLVHLRQVHPL